MFGLEGRTAVVTGASRGIGRAIAEGMAAAGAKVMVSSRKLDACEQVVASIATAGGEAIATRASSGAVLSALWMAVLFDPGADPSRDRTVDLPSLHRARSDIAGDPRRRN